MVYVEFIKLYSAYVHAPLHTPYGYWSLKDNHRNAFVTLMYNDFLSLSLN